MYKHTVLEDKIPKSAAAVIVVAASAVAASAAVVVAAAAAKQDYNEYNPQARVLTEKVIAHVVYLPSSFTLTVYVNVPKGVTGIYKIIFCRTEYRACSVRNGSIRYNRQRFQ